MKWIRENYKGEKVVWYSADVIEKIEYLCLRMPYQAIEKILEIIENEDE